jgi:antitoxin component HigA of HigAB toxin-antitoxin module
MLVVVKNPRTKTPMFEIRGEIPERLLQFLKTEMKLTVALKEDEEEYIVASETDWYKETKESTTLGDVVRIYRDNSGYSQSKLGQLLGGLSRHRISDIENDRRGISKDMAKKLSKIFKIPVDRFI